MSETYAVRMDVTDAASLGRVRHQSGLQICQEDNVLWLYLNNGGDDAPEFLRTLPGRRFTVLPDRQLIPIDALLPQGHLPEGPWIAAPLWMPLQLDSPAFSGLVSQKCPLRIVRSTEAADANLIKTDINRWRDYATCAPQVRLDRLSFAMNERQEVIVLGTPLPPLPGVRYVANSGVAIEAGWTCEPAVQPEVLREILKLDDDETALLHASGEWERISEDSFVKATRTSVRATAEERAHE